MKAEPGKTQSALEREVRFIDPEDVKIWRDRFGQLRVKLADGREFRDVHPSLAFPISHANRMLILRDADLAEIGIIDEFTSLDEQSNQVLHEELEKAYFVPRIVSINSAQEQRGIAPFKVDTDRRPRTIQVQFHHRIRILGGGRVIIHDVDANRYEIPSLADLDPRSRALLDEFL